MKVKKPAESKGPWDYLTVMAKIPAAEAFRPQGTSGCSLTKAP
jgi:branched-chain amino acid transport system substrate-binding protein